MKNFINLTPHNIKVVTDSDTFVYPPSGIVARVTTIENIVEYIDGIPFVSRQFENVKNIPEEKEDTFYIVSSLVKSATIRKDVVSPDTGETAIRLNGNVIAVTRFII